MPKRVQRKRTKAYRMPDGVVYVGRPTKWGNPWTPKNSTVAHVADGTCVSSRPATVRECVAMYGVDVKQGTFGYGPEDVRRELAGKDLACWCPLDQPRHADVLLEIANSPFSE